MQQRPYNPPEPRVIAIAATKPQSTLKPWVLWAAAYALSAITLCQWLSH